MTELTRDDVLHLALLARLELTDNEVETFRKEMSDILRYVAQLNGTDVEGLEPTTQVTGLKNVMRDDEIIDYEAKPDDLIKLAPKTIDRQIKVNRMIE